VLLQSAAAPLVYASGQFVDAEESFDTTFDDCQEYAFELDSEMEVFCDCNDTL
jgi:hypothetical protein